MPSEVLQRCSCNLEVGDGGWRLLISKTPIVFLPFPNDISNDSKRSPGAHFVEEMVLCYTCEISGVEREYIGVILFLGVQFLVELGSSPPPPQLSTHTHIYQTVLQKSSNELL